MDRHNQAISLKFNMLMNFSFTFHLLIDRYWNPNFHHIQDLTRTASCLRVSQSIPYMTRVPYTIHHTPWYEVSSYVSTCIATTPPTAVDVQLVPNLRAWIIVYCTPVRVRHALPYTATIADRLCPL